MPISSGSFFLTINSSLFSYPPVRFDILPKRVPGPDKNQLAVEGGRNNMVNLKSDKVYEIAEITQRYFGKTLRVESIAGNTRLA